jgi:hypothetical protein
MTDERGADRGNENLLDGDTQLGSVVRHGTSGTFVNHNLPLNR